MKAVPICGTPALMLKQGEEKTIVISDLHLGIEHELAEKGISLPGQIPALKARLISLIEWKGASRLIILGDVKHNVPETTWHEWRELPGLFEKLARLVKVDIVRGNHDGDLEGMVPREVTIHDPHGIVLGKRKKVGLMHGHTWPAPELVDTELIIAGHNHPAIEFRDELGGRSIEPVWLRAELNPKKLPKKLLPPSGRRLPKLIVVPAFSELVGGAVLNRDLPKELIGPLFRSGAVKLDEAEAYLLDGTFLGKIKTLR
ncbi:MAG: metallophosphoesterase [Candidatus Hadarchaeum sp.]|uniref:metallophosphoesterase n=1 Tax=Candidatus Hadarchaeum sp. TaxID=2883567 RepID=UPI003D0DF74E